MARISSNWRFPISSVCSVPNYESVASILNCCIKCGGIPQDKSYVCTKGHVTCVECQPPGDVALQCRYRSKGHIFSEVCGREIKRVPCFVHTILLKSSVVSCSLAECEITADQIQNHRLVCPGRQTLTCCMPSCDGKLFSPLTFSEHLREHDEVEYYSRCGGCVTHCISDWMATSSYASEGEDTTTIPFILEHESGVHLICVCSKATVDDMPLIFITLYKAFARSTPQSGNPDDPICAKITFFGINRFSKSWKGLLLRIGEKLENATDITSCSSLVVPDFSYAATGFIRIETGEMDDSDATDETDQMEEMGVANEMSEKDEMDEMDVTSEFKDKDDEKKEMDTTDLINEIAEDC